MSTQHNSSDDIADKAGTVTRISFQKKRTDRRSIFIDNEYAFSVSEQTYLSFPLHEGQQLTVKQISAIRNHEDYEKAKEITLRYLGIRMRSEYELTRYLQKKEYRKQVITRVVNYCQERGYLDDTKYTEMLSRDMVNINRYGKNKIYAMLRKRGISSETITPVLNKQIDQNEQLKIALELAQKKLKIIKDETKAREKIYRYLNQRGFNYSIVNEVINRLFKY
ncbi:MAG: RecX family transcriptional regulator [Candidatus Marinimicrobia bacterium]|nr:RecX family transcriptional regulator [Candidatus Neomarinimicrobiota bacterium]